MARLKKSPGAKRDKRLTLYLAGREKAQLGMLAESTGMNKTKISGQNISSYPASAKTAAAGPRVNFVR